MKKLLTALLILALVCSLALSVSAAGEKVVDDAGLLSSRELSSLRSKTEAIAEAYRMDVVIVTVDSLGGKTATAFADDYFDFNGYGYGSKYSGVLLLVAMNEREWAVSTCGYGKWAITNSEIDIIMEEVLPYLSAGNYNYAFNQFLDLVEMEYEAGWSGDLFTRLVISLLIGAVVALVALLIMRGRMNTAKAQHGAASYLKQGSYDLYRCQDFYLYSHTTRVRKQDNNGSGSHRSSSGRSHGGRSGRF